MVSDASACKRNDDSLAEASGMKVYNSLKYMDEDDAEDLLTEIMGVDNFNEHIANFINEMQGNEDPTTKYQVAFKSYILKQESNLLKSFQDGLSLSLPKELIPYVYCKGTEVSDLWRRYRKFRTAAEGHSV